MILTFDGKQLSSIVVNDESVTFFIEWQLKNAHSLISLREEGIIISIIDNRYIKFVQDNNWSDGYVEHANRFNVYITFFELYSDIF